MINKKVNKHLKSRITPTPPPQKVGMAIHLIEGAQPARLVTQPPRPSSPTESKDDMGRDKDNLIRDKDDLEKEGSLRE